MIAKKIPKPSDTDFVHGIRVERPKVYRPVNPADLMPAQVAATPSVAAAKPQPVSRAAPTTTGASDATKIPVPNVIRPGTMRSVEPSLWSKVLTFFGWKGAPAASSPRVEATGRDAGMRVGDIPGVREAFERVDRARAKPQPVHRAAPPATGQQADASLAAGYGVEPDDAPNRRGVYKWVDGQFVAVQTRPAPSTSAGTPSATDFAHGIRVERPKVHTPIQTAPSTSAATLQPVRAAPPATGASDADRTRVYKRVDGQLVEVALAVPQERENDSDEERDHGPAPGM